MYVGMRVFMYAWGQATGGQPVQCKSMLYHELNVLCCDVICTSGACGLLLTEVDRSNTVDTVEEGIRCIRPIPADKRRSTLAMGFHHDAHHAMNRFAIFSMRYSFHVTSAPDDSPIGFDELSSSSACLGASPSFLPHSSLCV
jgi:hypothetical protein